MLPINEIICGHNVDVLATFPDACIDLTVTSPPYDNLRTYNGYTFDFDGIAQQLYRVTKCGGVVVWVVADATVNGSETGTSFRQALRFMEIGFNLHDTMIYHKDMQHPNVNGRYQNCFEYMFVLSKGTPKTINLLTRQTKTAGKEYINTGKRQRNGDVTLYGGAAKVVADAVVRQNVWTYLGGFNHITKDKFAYEHSAMFPEKLAEDHILSWSNPDDIVLDPFLGSGTTAKMAIKHHRRYIGIDVSPEYCDLARKRITGVQRVMFDMASQIACL